MVTNSIFKKLESVKHAIEAGEYILAGNLLAMMRNTEMSLAAQDLASFYAKQIGRNFQTNTPVTYSDGKLSSMDSDITQSGISIVTCCMNRNENLVKALHSWLALQIDEIIIVDWSSDKPVAESLVDIDDDRIKILRVEGESKWVLTYAFNVGLRFASYSKVYKLDSDIVVTPDFLFLNDFARGEYVRGSWKQAVDSGRQEQVHVNGSFGAWKKDLREIAYYKEVITTYGWDDSDLYERLSSSLGLKTKYLNMASITHIEQTEHSRTANQSIQKTQFLDCVPATDFHIQRNKFIGRNVEFWFTSQLQDYEIKRISPNEWQAFRMTHDIHIAKHIEKDANAYAALQFLLAKRPQLLQKRSNAKALANFVYQEYAAGMPLERTEQLLRLKPTIAIFNLFSESLTVEEVRRFFLAQLNKVDVVLVLSDDYRRETISVGEDNLEVIAVDHAAMKAITEPLPQYKTDDDLYSKASFVAYSLLRAALLSFKPKKKIYIDVQHGLGNRLRALASAAVIAKNTGWELVVVWEPDHHCDCELSDLLDYDGSVITQSFCSDARDKGFDIYNVSDQYRPGSPHFI